MAKSQLKLFTALSARILLAACVLTPILGATLYQIFYQTLSNSFIDSSRNDLFEYAQLLELQTSDYYSEDEIKLFLDNLLFNADVVDIHLARPDKEQIIKSAYSAGLSNTLPEDTKLFGNGDHYFVQTIPVTLNTNYAELRAVFSEDYIRSQLNRATLLGSVFVLVFTTFLLLFSFRQFQRISRVATELRLNAERIAEGEKGVDLDVESDIDEFRGLSLSLDRMHNKLEAQKSALSRQVFNDPLTKIANRLFFGQLLERYHHSLSKKQQHFAVALMDINNFKQVNDSYGHPMGDRLLVLTARLLTRVVRVVNGRVARIGGDEFALIFLAESPETINSVAGEISSRISRMVYLSDRRIELAISIGGVFVNSADITEDEIVKRADVALYAAKRDLRNRVRIFDDQLFLSENRHDAILEALKSQSYLKPESGFGVRFQPKFDLFTMRATGFEALVYWNHPTLGYLRPDHFIPLAEQQGMMTLLSTHIIRTCLGIIARWRDEFGLEIPVAINISPHDLKDPYFVSRTLLDLDKTGVSPENIEFEVTENAFVDDYKVVRSTLAELTEKGVSIAIDDFGVGYSNLANLNNLPANTIKIDKMFIQGCEQGNDRYYIVRSVIELAENLGLDCIAEGIDNPEISNLLREMGCRYGQGEWLDGYFSESGVAEFWQKQISLRA